MYVPDYQYLSRKVVYFKLYILSFHFFPADILVPEEWVSRSGWQFAFPCHYVILSWTCSRFNTQVASLPLINA